MAKTPLVNVGASPGVPEPRHYFRIEVTVLGCIITPEGEVLERNTADVTLAFAMHISAPPPNITDEQINNSIAASMSLVPPAIQQILTSMGLAFLGVVDEPIIEAPSRTLAVGKTEPVTVLLVQPPTGKLDG